MENLKTKWFEKNVSIDTLVLTKHNNKLLSSLKKNVEVFLPYDILDFPINLFYMFRLKPLFPPKLGCPILWQLETYYYEFSPLWWFQSAWTFIATEIALSWYRIIWPAQRRWLTTHVASLVLGGISAQGLVLIIKAYMSIFAVLPFENKKPQQPSASYSGHNKNFQMFLGCCKFFKCTECRENIIYVCKSVYMAYLS